MNLGLRRRCRGDTAHSPTGGTLSVNNQGLEANVQVVGHHQINVPIQAQDNTTFTIGSDAGIGLTDNAALSLSQGITVAAGKLLQKPEPAIF